MSESSAAEFSASRLLSQLANQHRRPRDVTAAEFSGSAPHASSAISPINTGAGVTSRCIPDEADPDLTRERSARAVPIFIWPDTSCKKQQTFKTDANCENGL